MQGTGGWLCSMKLPKGGQERKVKHYFLLCKRKNVKMAVEYPRMGVHLDNNLCDHYHLRQKTELNQTEGKMLY